MSPKKRSRKKTKRNLLFQEVARLEEGNEKLRGEVKKAETIIELQ